MTERDNYDRKAFADHHFAKGIGKGLYFPAFPAKFSKKPIFPAFPVLLVTLIKAIRHHNYLNKRSKI